MNLVLFVFVGLIAGALAGRVVSGHGYGVLGDVVVGILGAFVGGWFIAPALGIGGGGLVVSLFIAVIGAIAMLWLVRLVAPRLA